MWTINYALYEDDPLKKQMTYDLSTYFEKLFVDLDNKQLVSLPSSS